MTDNNEREDLLIKEKIDEIFLWDPEVDASEIEVKVQDGRVLINGFVDSRHAKTKAEQLLKQVKGISDIQNRLVIRKDLDTESDKIITRGDDGFHSEEIIQR